MYYRDDLLRAAAGAKNKSNVDIAAETGLNRDTVGRVMRGDARAGYLTILTVAQALGFNEIPNAPQTAAALDVNTLNDALPKERIA